MHKFMIALVDDLSCIKNPDKILEIPMLVETINPRNKLLPRSLVLSLDVVK